MLIYLRVCIYVVLLYLFVFVFACDMNTVCLCECMCVIAQACANICWLCVCTNDYICACSCSCKSVFVNLSQCAWIKRCASACVFILLILLGVCVCALRLHIRVSIMYMRRCHICLCPCWMTRVPAVLLSFSLYFLLGNTCVCLCACMSIWTGMCLLDLHTNCIPAVICEVCSAILVWKYLWKWFHVWPCMCPHIYTVEWCTYMLINGTIACYGRKQKSACM